MKKKLKDFAEEERTRICNSQLRCEDCPFVNIRYGCGVREEDEDPNQEVEIEE